MTKDEILQFGKMVKAKRQKLGLTQQELAQELAVSKGSIAAIEVGVVRSIGIKMVKKINEYFDSKCIEEGNEGKSTGTAIPNYEAKDVLGMIQNLASLVSGDDFETKVEQIKNVLRCSKEQAIFTIMLNFIQNKH